MKEQIEDLIRAAGGTMVRIDFGPHAYITFRDLDGEPEGWEVVDNRRRYPQSAASSLTFDDAARYAKNIGRNNA